MATLIKLNAAEVKKDLKALGYTSVRVCTDKHATSAGALIVHLRDSNHKAAQEYFGRKNIVEFLTAVDFPQATNGNTFAYLYGL